MNKKISLGAAISITAVAVAIAIIVTMNFSQSIFNSKLNVQERTELTEIESFVRSNYLYDIDEQTETAALSAGYIAGLGDKYSHYYTAEEYQEYKAAASGTKVGIGIAPEKEESGYIRVQSVEKSSPAEESAIVAGDIIVAVNDSDVIGIGYDAAAAMLDAGEGTTVNVTVRRDGEDKQYQLVSRRMDIVSVTGRLIEDTAYIRIAMFDGRTAEQFKAKYDELVTAGANSLVIDVRNNNGGSLDSVSGVLSNLIPAGDVVYATYKDGTKKAIVSSEGKTVTNLPTAVLVNEKTASAAEMFAAVLRDSIKASLVGTVTYGKGVIQNLNELTSGSAMEITVATYETLKTPNFDGVGLKPNFEVAFSIPEGVELETLDEATDAQLAKALDVAKTNIVEE